MSGWQLLVLSALPALRGTHLGIMNFMKGSPLFRFSLACLRCLSCLCSQNVSKDVAEAIGLKAVKLPSKEDYKKIWRTVLRSCGIGTFIGILPAEGATVASMIGYSEARRWSKNKEEFGKGSIEGIAGAEAANNAATGGAMVPTMVLGIPGSGTTAIILVGLMVHGLRPGPYLFTEQVDTVYQIFGAMLVANFMFLFMGLYAAKFFARISLIPTTLAMAYCVCTCVLSGPTR